MRDKSKIPSILKTDLLWILGLSGAALILYTYNLGELALRDWDEGIVAGVARNIWRGTENSHVWLYPTINYDQPYWNKPPLIHWLIAIAYGWFGISEWTTRLPPAIISALSVPLLYKLAREILPTRIGAIFSALVYLTLLPMVRHSRLAMLDGAIACWFILTIWCLLRSRNSSQYFLGVGIGFGLVCLTKGLMMGVLLGAISLIFILWDAPKLLRSGYLWFALILGTFPAIAWYIMQYWHYGEEFIAINLGQQTFSRIWESVGERSTPPWYYLLEILKYTFPWLLFLPGGIVIALKEKHSSWAKLVLVWSGIYLIAISSMVTKLPWYIIPFYPAWSLLVGANLAIIWQTKAFNSLQMRIIGIFVSLLALAIWLTYIFYNAINISRDPSLRLILAMLACTFTIVVISLWLKHRYFMIFLFLGLYSSLLLLFNSQLWVWELAEAFPVKPVAEVIKQHTPDQQIVYTSYPYNRPALEFYSERVVIPASDEELKKYWQQKDEVYFLLDSQAIIRLNLDFKQTLGYSLNSILTPERTSQTTDTWQLITRIN
ncbi:MAG: glycosyltransferase family 39 protein [Xenococcaceae cyanobacterium MO_167.B52]|nr:glycosyltransferase family 39 protein [Xenococcaceae cyanobacterium MO_167.B52]